MIKKILLLILIIFGVTGCYNYQELSDLAIVSGVSIALSDHQYEVSVQVINPRSQQDASGSEEPDFIIYKKKDSSIQEAIRKIAIECPKKLYLSHMNILIIDESIAKGHLKYVLDFFIRHPDIRDEFYVLIGRNSDILSITTPLENISSESILNSLKNNAKELGYTDIITFQELVAMYLNPYQELAISSAYVYGNQLQGNTIDNIKNTDRNASVIVSGIAIFKDNSLVGYLEENDALTYHILRNDYNHFLIKTSYSNSSFFVSEILQEVTKIDVDLSHFSVTISINGNAMITENNTSYHLEDNKTILRLQKDINDTLSNMIEKSISNVFNKYHTDIFGFCNLFYHKNPNFIEKHWNDNSLEQLKISVKTNIKLVEKGNLNGGLIHE